MKSIVRLQVSTQSPHARVNCRPSGTARHCLSIFVFKTCDNFHAIAG